VGCTCIAKQKMVLFLTFRKNDWVAAGNALTNTGFVVFIIYLYNYKIWSYSEQRNLNL
jgi:hypothetical protein